MKIFTEKRQKELFEDVRRFYNTHEYDYGHRFDHIVRVIWWCILFSKKEKADLSILLPAVILHDVGKMEGIKSGHHPQMSYKMCFKFLKKHGYNKNESKKISQAILAHSIQHSEIPRSIEEKVIFDIDKLDAIGAIGLHRWFFEYSKYGSHDIAIKEMLKDFKKWKRIVGKVPFYTKTAKKIGSNGVLYIEKIFNDTEKDFKKFRKIYKELNIG